MRKLPSSARSGPLLFRPSPRRVSILLRWSRNFSYRAKFHFLLITGFINTSIPSANYCSIHWNHSRPSTPTHQLRFYISTAPTKLTGSVPNVCLHGDNGTTLAHWTRFLHLFLISHVNRFPISPKTVPRWESIHHRNASSLENH